MTQIIKLKKRSQFLRVKDGARFATPGLVLQARRQAQTSQTQIDEAERAPDPARFGFTASKTVGGAVKRNRARRRLKELVRLHAGPHASKGFDYVLIARQGTLQRPFAELISDLERAFLKVHRPAPQKR